MLRRGRVRQMRLRLTQRFRGLHQLAGPFHDTLFEFVFQSVDFRLACLSPAVSIGPNFYVA
jgi:hypothetical protein